MTAINDIQNIYFIGIGGIGMSALARYFNSIGAKVSGYDRTRTDLCQLLELEGITIHYTDDILQLDKEAQLVVFTPAVPSTHNELNWYRNNGFNVVKRSDVLQIISANSFNICVAGTHGKTSISAMIGHILKHSGYGCNAFLGGIAVNYNTNFWANSNNVCVIEADEYDRSFHKLSPDIAVITSMDADHLDIYGTEENLQDAFVEFAKKIKPQGLLIRKQNLVRLNKVENIDQLTYALKESIDLEHSDIDSVSTKEKPKIFASNIQVNSGCYLFTAIINNVEINNIRLNIGGLHNIENMLAAITVAVSLGIETEKIKNAVESYKGVKRRFEYIINKTTIDTQGATKKLIFIDDYAHHPEELNALILSTKNLFPNEECTIIFQPHLYSRTRDLAEGFAASLDKAENVWLLPIYPARELPIEGVNSHLIKNAMQIANVEVLSKEDILKKIKTITSGIIITAGAGDIDTIIPLIKKTIEEDK